jgi:glycosyltransferase 2 family protein
MNIRVLSIIISVAIIVLLYWQIDISKVIHVFLQANLIWLFLGLLLVIPITLLTAFRLTFLSMRSNKINYLDALKLILAASVMNLVLPSKMGDLAKGVFIVKDKNINYTQALPLVVFEKMSDLLALLLWCVIGLIFLQNYSDFYIILLSTASTFLTIGILTISSKFFTNIMFALIMYILPKRFSLSVSAFQKGWFEAIDFIKKDGIKIWTLSLLAIFLWFLHLLQIWLFIFSLSPNVDFLVSLAITPIAIFAGLIPLTFSGIGTRDFSFIYFYSAYFSAATGAALGILATLRYVIPAIVGIPFFSHYLKKIR